jgi:hypothetical protein
VRARSADELLKAMRHKDAGAINVERDGLDRILRFDAAHHLVEVQVGTSWAALCAYLSECGPGLTAFAECEQMLHTIGESVAVNAAGPDGRPVVTHVESLAIVTPDGSMRRASRFVNKELFALAVGGQDLFGAPYSVTLRVDSLLRSARDRRPAELLEIAPAGDEASHCILRLLVPPQRLGDVVSEVREHCADWRIPIRHVAARRVLPEDETLLRWARSECAELTLRFAVPAVLGGSVRSVQLRRELIDVALAAGGGFPIADTFHASREQTEACYPELKTFLAEKRRRDPEERLNNAWYHHYRGLLAREVCPVRWSAP